MPGTPNILRAFARSHTMERTASTLSSTLEEDIPTCAQQCVSDSVTSYFNSTTCSSTTDLDCLCSHYSTQGLTLGETAFVCLDTANCQAEQLNATASLKAYDVCAGQTDAVAATHSVLTSFETAALPTVSVTISQTTSVKASGPAAGSTTVTGTSSSLLDGTSSRVSASTASSSLSTRASVSKTSAGSSSGSGEPSTFATSTVSASIMRSPVSTISSQLTISTTMTATNGTTTLASKAGTSKALTTGQAVGVSLGTCGGVGIFIALLICCVCARRKKQEKEEEKDKDDGQEEEKKQKKRRKNRRSFDFVDKSPAAGATFPTRVFVLRDGQAVPSARSPHRLEANSVEEEHDHDVELPRNGLDPNVRPRKSYDLTGHGQKRTTQWPLQKNGIVVPTARTKEVDDSRTTPTRPTRPSRPDSNVTTFTWFEEDHSSSHPHDPPSLPNSPGLTFAPPTLPGLPSGFADRYARSREEPHQPSLSLEIPPSYASDDHTSHHFLPSPTQLTPDSPAMAARFRRSQHSSLPPNSAISYLPSYYTSADSRTPVAHSTSRFSPYRSSHLASPPSFSPPLPLNHHFPPPEPTLRPPPAPFAAATQRSARTSLASSTTDFESLSPDDVTPPTEDEYSAKKLETLLESPITGVRYPKVPRASNQSVPRVGGGWGTPKVSRWTSSIATTAFSPGRKGNSASSSPAVGRRGRAIEQEQEQEQEQEIRVEGEDKHGRRTLLNKRRGEDMRLYLEGERSPSSDYGTTSATVYDRGQGLRITETGSPSRRNKRVGTEERATGGPRREQTRSPDLVISSPLWNPKLTPSKRGEDMYIMVE